MTIADFRVRIAECEIRAYPPSAGLRSYLPQERPALRKASVGGPPA